MRLRLSAVAVAVDGELLGDDVEVDGVSIDSRSVDSGMLFVPIVAERDGHDFVGAAMAAGAMAHLTATDVVAGPAVRVDDTAVALARLGAHVRQLRGGEVIGITGSVGKTTTKDLLAAAIGATRPTHASWRSFNNELGVPLTLLNAPEGTEVTVVEMGARGVGHIAELCRIASPTIAVVLAVGAAHTEHFGDLDGVARAKGELVESLPATGTAVLNADDDRVAAMASRTSAQVITFGERGDVRAENVRLDDRLRAGFDLRSPWGSVPVVLATAGRHAVHNALAALAAAMTAGGDLEAAASALATADVSPWRMEVDRTDTGLLVVNDAYNANPLSMHAAIDALRAVDARRRIAIIGIMAELGDRHEADHIEVGRRLADLGIEVVAVGVEEYGGTQVADADEAIALLDTLGPFGPETAILVKASRVGGLERVAAHLAKT